MLRTSQRMWCSDTKVETQSRWRHIRASGPAAEGKKGRAEAVTNSAL